MAMALAMNDGNGVGKGREGNNLVPTCSRFPMPGRRG